MQQPWMDSCATPAERAELVLAALTPEEKIGLVHAPMGFAIGAEPTPPGALGSAGHNPGVPRLGIPPLDETDASLGIANPRNSRPGAVHTALPSGLSLAATFDPQLARAAGAAIGVEARAAGFGVLLAGGVNLVREPRCGRNFEYLGEDALLAGTLAGTSVAGIQAQGVISTVKHFALNAQETGRMVVSSSIAEPAARESDLLAFELAIELGRPLSVMTAYNEYAGQPCSQSAFLLGTVLKGDWGFPGFVMSDWGGTLSTVDAALAGLDRQSGANLDPELYFGPPLLDAVRSGAVPAERLDDMVRRILVAMFSAGLFDERAALQPDLDTHAGLARQAAVQGTVLLTNSGVLPLDPPPARLLVVADHDGVLSGGGSSQVVPPGSEVESDGIWVRVHHPSSLTTALAERLPSTDVRRVRWAEALEAATDADVVIAVAEQWTTESADVPNLSLPDEDTLGELARTHPRVVVVLQTGGPVLMPWLDDVAALVQGWYPGGQGGPALADVLTGAADPGGRLPVTFPATLDQLPRPQLHGAGATSHPGGPRVGHFSEDYDIEGADVGYRWHERQGSRPLFWFGAGLAYTTFEYAELTVDASGERVRLDVTVTNTGSRAGTAVPQFYAALPGRTARLVGWARLRLEPGRSQRASVAVDPRLLAEWDHGWVSPTGPVVFSAGAHAGDRPLTEQVTL